MEESVGVESIEFKWGEKKAIGGKNKDIQFYKSFTYDGDDYSLYDCVLLDNRNQPDEPFVGKIIKIWERTNKRAVVPRQVKILWFFRPSQIAEHLEGVHDVLPNELFLASGEGLGVANVNQLEVVGGNCNVLCISKDKRNRQPSDEEIKSADFVFRRVFDVGSFEVSDTIDDKIAGVDVEFIFNRARGEEKETALQEVNTEIDVNLGSLKLNDPSASGSVKKEAATLQEIKKEIIVYSDGLKPSDPSASGLVRKIEDNSIESSDCEERSNDCEKDEDTRQESEVKKGFAKQKSMPVDERYSNTCEASGFMLNGEVNGIGKQLTKQKSMPAEERYCKESNGLDDRPQKKQKLDVSVTATDGCFKRPKDRVTREQVSPEKPIFATRQDLGVSVTKTATVKDKMLVDDIERNYQVIEVTRKPGVATWFRTLPWEESTMRQAEKQDRLVLLQNLDPTYTSDEVEDIVYSALNEECTARMIECTSATTPRIGQALVIFKSTEAAERVIVRLDEGCLLLSNGRPLIAGFAKTNPPGKPLPFPGHIKVQKTQMRHEMRDAVATSHCSQPNTVEFEMAMEWCLLQARSDYVVEDMTKRQLEERKSLQINFKPKLP